MINYFNITMMTALSVSNHMNGDYASEVVIPDMEIWMMDFMDKSKILWAKKKIMMDTFEEVARVAKKLENKQLATAAWAVYRLLFLEVILKPSPIMRSYTQNQNITKTKLELGHTFRNIGEAAASAGDMKLAVVARAMSLFFFKQREIFYSYEKLFKLYSDTTDTLQIYAALLSNIYM